MLSLVLIDWYLDVDLKLYELIILFGAESYLTPAMWPETQLRPANVLRLTVLHGVVGWWLVAKQVWAAMSPTR